MCDFTQLLAAYVFDKLTSGIYLPYACARFGLSETSLWLQSGKRGVSACEATDTERDCARTHGPKSESANYPTQTTLHQAQQGRTRN